MHFRHVCFVALAALVCVPAAAFAADWEWEGWNGDWNDWYDSSYRDKVEDLGDDIVNDLPIPVLVGVERSDLTKNFGDPRGGGTRKHEGLDIVATDGTPVASPTDAVVVRTGNGSDSGLYVRTVGPGGEAFVYMHLSKIADDLEEGDVVERGEVIGFVGNTGNASGGHAHLHLEIRQDGEPTNPYPRLTEVFSQREREEGLEQALKLGGDDDLIALLQKELEGDDEEEDEVAAVKPAKSTLVFGATNSEVVALQKFLIAAESGDSATRLGNTGATGYFGPLTQAALREYQRETKLDVTGVVDDDTYALVFAQREEPDPPTVADEDKEENEEVAGAETSATFTRDLEVGVTGSDVRRLQEYLNEQGYTLATDGPGSPGNETDMFGGLTRAALAKYQAANNISPAIGYFGPITRAHVLAKLAAL